MQHPYLARLAAAAGIPLLLVAIAACGERSHADDTHPTGSQGAASSIPLPAAADPERPWLTGAAPTTTTATTSAPAGADPSTTTTTSPPPPPCRPAVTTSGDVLFDVDDATLSEAGIAALRDKLASLCADHSTPLTVVGHTDSDGSEEHNQQLSESRAAVVADWMRDAGYTSVTSSGAGETQPIADNGTADGRQLNRRVVISIAGPTP